MVVPSALCASAARVSLILHAECSEIWVLMICPRWPFGRLALAFPCVYSRILTVPFVRKAPRFRHRRTSESHWSDDAERRGVVPGPGQVNFGPGYVLYGALAACDFAMAVQRLNEDRWKQADDEARKEGGKPVSSYELER